MGGLLPPRVEQLLEEFSQAGRLFGHGVLYSPTSSCWEPRQRAWLSQLKEECRTRRFQHITEHFGFMTAGGAIEGCPLPLRYPTVAVQVGIDRLRRMHEAAGGDTPIGLENLALAMGMEDVVNQGPFIEAVLAPFGDQGVMLLDLHNLYCQIVNFSLSAEEAIKRYPLERVHAIHISGGSWCDIKCDPQAPPFRRDTHDGDVPSEIITQLLPLALRLCPNIEVVILERLGETICSKRDEERLRQDFCLIRAVVQEVHAKQSPSPATPITITGAGRGTGARPEDEGAGAGRLAVVKRVAVVDSSPAQPFEDEELGRYQAAFLRLFIQDLSPDQLLHELRTLPDFAPYRQYVEGFDRRCVEVASTLVHKWVRFRRADLPKYVWRRPWWLEDEES